ncbi:MAG: hypothetical protein CXX81_00905 [Methanobacteriota archaeon]|nr:MAG: hypothetical protein CXX81_14300 [Euryarchaeota archaeon]PXY76789.1 MAG: hypothetical protein CXX81_13730 [Euryarchaeota archaeon]PXY79697.1 MAG: hypothetical protein CXX81_00905 [Euryarchaeota archaeon]
MSLTWYLILECVLGIIEKGQKMTCAAHKPEQLFKNHAKSENHAQVAFTTDTDTNSCANCIYTSCT